MTRRLSIAGLFAALAAEAQQRMTTTSPTTDWQVFMPSPPPPKPLPDQCPVCRTMAKPFVRPTEKEYYKGLTCVPPPSTDGASFSSCLAPGNSKTGPKEHLTRCAHCNAAFWQDAKE